MGVERAASRDVVDEREGDVMANGADKRYRLLIGGEWVDGDEGTSPVINPATEEVVGHAPEASIAQAEAAARAAQEAFPGWWRTQIGRAHV